MLILCLALVLCHVGDYLSTRKAFAAGAVEANPVVRRLGLLPAKLLGAGITTLPLWVLGSTLATGVYTAVVCLAYAWVIRNNQRLAQYR